MKFQFGINSISSLNIPLTLSICLVSFAASFGSLSVIFQLYAASHNIKINIIKLIIYKFISGILSGLISYYLVTITPFFTYVHKASNVFLNNNILNIIDKNPLYSYATITISTTILYIFLIFLISLIIRCNIKKSG